MKQEMLGWLKDLNTQQIKDAHLPTGYQAR